MELHSIIFLTIIIVAISSITYFLKIRKSSKLPKHSDKQEPRFDLHHSSLDNEEGQENWDDISHDENNLLLDDPLLAPKASVKKNPEQETLKKNKSSVEEIIYFILAAKANKPYVGYELLQALLSAGLRFGPMNIFHRHEDMNGNGKILFSLASATEPGSFEITKMGAFSGKALMLFLRLSSNKDTMFAFESMLETAKQLIEDLDGDILDDERKILSPDKIEKIKKQISEFEQSQLIGDLFDQQALR